jgi:hypothetical protein
MIRRDLRAALRRTRARRAERAPDAAAIKTLVAAVRRQAQPRVAKVDRASIDRLTAGALKQVRTR